MGKTTNRVDMHGPGGAAVVSTASARLAGPVRSRSGVPICHNDRPCCRIALVAVEDLTEPERLWWAAFPHGAWVDVRTGDAGSDDLASASSWGQGRLVRAEVIRALLLGGGDTEPGHAPAVRLRGARVVGRLDLMGATTTYPLVCERCIFDEELRFVEASTKTVRIVESRLPALNGTRMRLDGILNMWRSEVAGVLRLDEARLTGQLCLREAVIGPAGGAEAVAASGLAVEGGAELAGLTARGSVVLDIASISGSLDLSRARISCPRGAGARLGPRRDREVRRPEQCRHGRGADAQHPRRRQPAAHRRDTR